MITEYKDLLDSIINPTTTYLVKEPSGNEAIKSIPAAGDTIVKILGKEEQLNKLVIEAFGETSELGREKPRELKEGKYWLTKAEYEYLLALFAELRRRTPSPYLSTVEKDHPLFKRTRVGGTLTSTTTTEGF